jgi:hypothetical protein
MLYNHKVLSAFEQKRSKFQAYQQDLQQQRTRLGDWLDQFCAYESAAMLDVLEQFGIPWPGAWPTAELDQATRLAIPFAQQWSNHVEARAWALITLKDRPVAAVDGSQIAPTKDYSAPVGAVQIGWYINYHRAGGSYLKDVAFEILAPDELLEDGAAADNPDSNYPTQRVNLVRFVRECEKLCELMAEFADTHDEAKPLCFFDGSFIISFTGQMMPRHAEPYLQAVRRLLACSERYRVPLIGFVDTSLSQDVVTLMETLQHQPDALRLTDGGLIKTAGLLPNWGDRTPLFLCARNDGLTQNGRAEFYKEVAFTYIQLAMERPPARLELPRWMVESGRAEAIIDLVRAECVVGAGYPYVLETVDALAVISQQDRQRFFALFEQFAQKAGLTFTQTRKAASKLARR